MCTECAEGDAEKRINGSDHEKGSWHGISLVSGLGILDSFCGINLRICQVMGWILLNELHRVLGATPDAILSGLPMDSADLFAGV